MKRFTMTVAVVLSATLAGATERPSDGWQEARRDRELTILFRDNRKFDAREVVATTEMNAPPEAVFEVVTDFLNYPKFMPYVKEVKILSRQGDVLVQYTLLATPLIAQRDSVNEVHLTRGTPENGGVFRSEWVTHPDAAPRREGVVRVPLNTGAWIIAPIDNGRRSHVTYTILTNPGGNVPRFMTDQSNTMFMPDLFKVVRERATRAER